MAEETRAVRTVDTGESKDRILIVEDEDNARKGYEQLLQRWGYDVLGVSSAEDALAKFSSFQPDTLIADVELPGMNGLDLLKQLGEEILDVPAIIITGKGSEERAVAAIESGAFWYIEKPLKGPVLRALLDRALSKARDKRNLAVLQRQLREAGRQGDLVGSSKPMQNVMRIIEMAGPSSASVLITGETGAGKEIVARTIHKLSPRASGPFVAINCSAIPESLMESEIFGHERGAFTGAAERRIGCFELADGGTLLLDEIGANTGQIVAGAGRPQSAAAGQQDGNSGGCARGGGNQQGSGAGRGQRADAAGFVFPAERISYSSAAAA
jgi:DNA-binding NtrC family response regulator